jgi:hypothetical protein
MGSIKDETSVFGKSILDIQKEEKEKEEKKKQKERMREYQSRSYVKERIKLQRESKAVSKRIKEMDEDQHSICKKLGKTIAHSRHHPEYRFKCTKCEASFSENEEKHFFNKFHCPCCHLKLRQRKTITQKRNISYENFSEKV